MVNAVELGLIVQLGLFVQLGRLALLRVGLRHGLLARQRGARGPERRHLDHVASEHDVREPEAAPDQTGIAKQRSHLIRQCIGRDVEILRVTAEHDIAHTAADQECLKSSVFESVQDSQRITGNVRA